LCPSFSAHSRTAPLFLASDGICRKSCSNLRCLRSRLRRHPQDSTLRHRLSAPMTLGGATLLAGAKHYRPSASRDAARIWADRRQNEAHRDGRCVCAPGRPTLLSGSRVLVHKHETGNTVSHTRNPVFQVIESRSGQPASQASDSGKRAGKRAGRQAGRPAKRAGSHRSSSQRPSSLERTEERVDATGIHTSSLLLRSSVFLFPRFLSPPHPSFLIDRSIGHEHRQKYHPLSSTRTVNGYITRHFASYVRVSRESPARTEERAVLLRFRSLSESRFWQLPPGTVLRHGRGAPQPINRSRERVTTPGRGRRSNQSSSRCTVTTAFGYERNFPSRVQRESARTQQSRRVVPLPPIAPFPPLSNRQLALCSLSAHSPLARSSRVFVLPACLVSTRETERERERERERIIQGQ